MAGARYVNKTSGTPCKREKYESDAYIWKGRSLEEILRRHGYQKTISSAEPTMVDVYMVGNLIYTVLTGQYLFEDPLLSTADAAKKLFAGERSPIPKEIESSTDPSYAAVMKALDMCWTQKWQDRPSAQTISTFLIDQLKEITGEEDPDTRVTLPERSSNQRGTHSDFIRVYCDRKPNGSFHKNCM